MTGKISAPRVTVSFERKLTKMYCLFVYWKKSATYSWRADLRVHKIIVLNKINKYINWIILKTLITKLELIYVI